MFQPQAPFPLGISIRNLTRCFDGRISVLSGLSLEIDSGEFVSLLGPSGCGKSTLLRLIAGLDRPDGGEIDFRADNNHASRRFDVRSASIAYVFQDPHLMPWRTVLTNVALPLELRGVGRIDRLNAARQALAQVGLADAAHRYPAQLSGGMRMRVSLARALVTDPQLLLLDEPFAALDELTRQKLDEQLYELWINRKMTVVFVTHSVSESVFLAGRAVVFSKRPARILLDRRLDLPLNRAGALRSDAVFSRECRMLYDALAEGGALI